MEIKLEDLASKKAKGAEGLTISDHTIDLNNFTGSELVLSGVGSRGLVLKNQKFVQITFKDFILDMASTGVAVKFDGVTSQILAKGHNAKIFGKAGNSASQLIYFLGTWNDVTVGGFELDQRRNSSAGSSVTGASLQFAGVPIKSLGEFGNGKVYIHDMTMRNSGDETLYVGHFKKIRDDGVEMADGVELVVERVTADKMGRDFGQQRGFRKVTFKDCSAKNIGLEAHVDHCSGFSLNDGSTEEILIDNCQIENARQFVYGGSTTRSVKAVIRNSTYTQGNHAGSRGNSGLYLKGPGKWTLEGCTINAPAVKYAAISADNCKVELIGNSNKITAPDIDRLLNGGTVKVVNPEPVITKETIEVQKVTTKPYNEAETVQYFLGEKELIFKP